MRILHMQHFGIWYEISLEPNTLGHVIRRGDTTWLLPQPAWVILGFSSHHWHRRITIPLTPEVDPAKLPGCLVWDRDHGTLRQWGGSYFGKLPRVQSAYIEERKSK